MKKYVIMLNDTPIGVCDASDVASFQKLSRSDIGVYVNVREVPYTETFGAYEEIVGRIIRAIERR